MHRKIKIILNPMADMGNAWRVARDLRSITEQHEGIDWSGTVYPGHAIQLAQQAGEQGYDLVIAMGGDGTVLRALDLFDKCPVLAINYGTVGFLTAGDRRDLLSIIERVISGRFIVSERLVLACQYPGGCVRAVNEVVLGTSYHLIHIDVFVDDTKIRTIRGDGVVVGTPTGSTALLLSAGAPIVMPDARCLILDGINEYNFTSRALILTPDSSVRLHLAEATRDCRVALLADGQQVAELTPGQQVRIARAPYTARLIYLEDSYFFHNLSSKLGW
jgi:NAD+ kinase